MESVTPERTADARSIVGSAILTTWHVMFGVLAAFALSSVNAWSGQFENACSCQGCTGEDRWAAKTDWAAIPSDPSAIKSIVPSAMYAWAPLPGLNDSSARKAPEEERWYKVTGRVTEVRVQQDGDIHFELTDATGRKRGHILAEVPIANQWCDLRKIVFGWTNKGAQFKPFHSPALLSLRYNVTVVVTGRAFFDVHHAARHPTFANRNVTRKTGNLAAWEIHPVAGIKVLSARPIARTKRRTHR